METILLTFCSKVIDIWQGDEKIEMFYVGKMAQMIGVFRKQTNKIIRNNCLKTCCG